MIRKLRNGDPVSSDDVIGARVILRKREVIKRTGLSDTTIWRLEKKDDFPRRVVITAGGSVGWYEDEVDHWVRDRVRASGKRAPQAPGMPRLPLVAAPK